MTDIFAIDLEDAPIGKQRAMQIRHALTKAKERLEPSEYDELYEIAKDLYMHPKYEHRYFYVDEDFDYMPIFLNLEEDITFYNFFSVETYLKDITDLMVLKKTTAFPIVAEAVLEQFNHDDQEPTREHAEDIYQDLMDVSELLWQEPDEKKHKSSIKAIEDDLNIVGFTAKYEDQPNVAIWAIASKLNSELWQIAFPEEEAQYLSTYIKRPIEIPESIQDKLRILTMPYYEAEMRYGDDYMDFLKEIEQEVIPYIEGRWEDHDPEAIYRPYKAGVVFNGEFYLTDYKSRKGNDWQPNCLWFKKTYYDFRIRMH